jgi:hypothetical protein
MIAGSCRTRTSIEENSTTKNLRLAKLNLVKKKNSRSVSGLRACSSSLHSKAWIVGGFKPLKMLSKIEEHYNEPVSPVQKSNRQKIDTNSMIEQSSPSKSIDLDPQESIINPPDIDPPQDPYQFLGIENNHGPMPGDIKHHNSMPMKSPNSRLQDLNLMLISNDNTTPEGKETDGQGE